MDDVSTTSWKAPPALTLRDRKWYARLAVSELLAQALLDMAPAWPTPRWKVETQKKRLAATSRDAPRAKKRTGRCAMKTRWGRAGTSDRAQ